MLGWINAATCTFMTAVVWQRRSTLRAVDEHTKITQRALTVCVILQTVALFLMSPASMYTVGRLLHAIFRLWNLDTYAGHCLEMAAAGMLAVHTAARLNLSLDELREIFRKWFQLPMTFTVAVMLALLVESPNASRERPDLYDVPTDHWLDAYWTVGCSFLILVCSTIIRILAVLLDDPRSRRAATLYISACVVAILICTLRIATTWTDDDYIAWFWFADCAVGAIIAYGASRSWRERAKRYSLPSPIRS